MKKHSVLSALVMAVMICLSGLAEADLNDGLMAYYPFNGNANDESGNSYDGTVNGAILTHDRFGNPDKAYSFDGEDDYIEVINSSAFNFRNGDFSVTCWVNSNSNTEQMIIHKTYRGNETGFWIRLNDGENIHWFNHPSHGIGSTTETATDGQWHFIVATRQLNVLSIYLEGQLISSGEGNVVDINSEGALKFGMATHYLSPYKLYDFANGIIDDIRIYNRALSESEIQELYNEQPCSGGFTQNDLDTARQEGYESGRQACIDNPASCRIVTDCEATFDMFTNTLHIPNFQDSYWLDLGLNNWEPVTFELKNMGEIGTK